MEKNISNDETLTNFPKGSAEATEQIGKIAAEFLCKASSDATVDVEDFVKTLPEGHRQDGIDALFAAQVIAKMIRQSPKGPTGRND